MKKIWQTKCNKYLAFLTFFMVIALIFSSLKTISLQKKLKQLKLEIASAIEKDLNIEQKSEILPVLSWEEKMKKLEQKPGWIKKEDLEQEEKKAIKIRKQFNQIKKKEQKNTARWNADNLPLLIKNNLEKYMRKEQLTGLQKTFDLKSFIEAHGTIVFVENGKVLGGVSKTTWYSTGRKTATGKNFNPHSRETIASNVFNFWQGPEIKLINLENGKKANVVVEDYGPFEVNKNGDAIYPLKPRPGIMFDCAWGVAEQMGFVNEGKIFVAFLVN